MVASKLEISFSWGLFSGAMMLVSGRVGKKVLTCICWRLRNHQILHHLGSPNDFGEIVMVIVILIIQNTAVILLSFNGCLCWFVVFSSSNWNRLSSRSSNLWSQPEINNSAIIKGSWYNHPFVQYTNWNHHEWTCLRVSPFIEFRNGFILPKWYHLTFWSFESCRLIIFSTSVYNPHQHF